MNETTLAYIDTEAITNEAIRAAAGVPPQCVGYPDGVPETWRTPSRLVAPVKQAPENAGKHFMDETWGGSGAANPEYEPDLAALAPEPPRSNSAVLGFSRLSSHWLEFEAKRNARIVNVSAAGYDPAALLGPACDPVEWAARDVAGDGE